MGYHPPASPMRELSGGLGGLNRQVSDSSAAVAAAAGLPSPMRPASATSQPASPAPSSATAVAAGAQVPHRSTAWELPGGIVLSEQQLQLLALAEEVEKLQAELDTQRSRNTALESQLLQASHSGSTGRLAGSTGRLASGSAGRLANGSSGSGAPAPAPVAAAASAPPAPRKGGYSFWAWVAGADRADAAVQG